LYMRKYLKDHLFNLWNNEAIFYENYNYTLDLRFIAGRLSNSKLRLAKKLDEVDRFDPTVYPLHTAIVPLANIIFTQNVTDTNRIAHQYDFDEWDFNDVHENWEGARNKDFYMISKPKDFSFSFKPFIKDEIYKRKIYSLMTWLNLSFSDEKLEEDKLKWLFPDDYFFEKDSILSLNTTTYNCDAGVRLYTLYKEHNFYLYFIDNDSNFFKNLKNYIWNYFLFYNKKNFISIYNLKNLYNNFCNYIIEDSKLVSLDLSDIPNASVEVLLNNYRYNNIGENNIFSFDIYNNYSDYPLPKKKKIQFDDRTLYYGDLGPILNLTESLYVVPPYIKHYNPLIVYNYI
jgi:hypothetical protein